MLGVGNPFEEGNMSANGKFQADLQQTKADFSQLESETERKADEAKAKVGAELDGIDAAIAAGEAARDAAVQEYYDKRDAGEVGLNYPVTEPSRNMLIAS